MTNLICKNCCKEFLINYSLNSILGKRRKFCSRKCYYDYLPKIKNTGRFQKGIKPNNTFSKGHIPWNKNKIGYSTRWKGGHHSKKTIEKLRKSHLGKVSVFGEKHGNWKGGISFEPYSLDWTRTLRRAIRERDNYICQLCSQYGNSIHHIDYDKKNCNPDNLITLCHSCNTQVNSNREYWKQYFYYLK